MATLRRSFDETQARHGLELETWKGTSKATSFQGIRILLPREGREKGKKEEVRHVTKRFVISVWT